MTHHDGNAAFADAASEYHQHDALRLEKQTHERAADVPHQSVEVGAAAVGLSLPPLRILSYHEMANLPATEWLIEGVVQERTAALLFGKSNTFKSFVGIDMLCSVATGTSWHGFETKGPAPCLYVATEGARGVGQQRIPGWMQAHNIAPDLRDNVFMYPQEIALDDDGAVSDLLQTCAHIKAERLAAQGRSVADRGDPSGAFAFIVIDVFGSSLSASETSDETARAWVQNIRRIMREVGCAVLTIAHTGWVDQTRARMHTHFWGSFDSRMKATGDKKNLTTVLTIDRHKDADSEGEWGFRMEKVDTPTGGATLVPRLCDEVVTPPKRPISRQASLAIQALKAATKGHGMTIAGASFPECSVVSIETWRTACDQHGLTDSHNAETVRKAFERAKNKLVEMGLVGEFDGYVWLVSDDVREWDKLGHVPDTPGLSRAGRTGTPPYKGVPCPGGEVCSFFGTTLSAFAPQWVWPQSDDEERYEVRLRAMAAVGGA